MTKIKKNNKLKLILPLAVLIFLILMPTLTAANDNNFKLNVPIGNVTDLAKDESLGAYIRLWYGFIIGTVGIVATVVMMIAGLIWLTSAGISGRVGLAKDMMKSGVIGLLIAFFSYTILYIINPNLTVISLPELKTIDVTIHTGTFRGANPQMSSGSRNSTSPRATGGSQAPGLPCPNGDYSRAYTASYEGYRSEPYWDVDGWSIGYGHHYPPGSPRPSPISDATGIEMFQRDYGQAYNSARSEFSREWSSLGPARQATLIDMAYNIGPGVFDRFSAMTSAVHSGDYNRAAEEILNSRYAQQLPQRSANNAELMRNNNSNLYAQQAQNNCL